MGGYGHGTVSLGWTSGAFRSSSTVLPESDRVSVTGDKHRSSRAVVPRICVLHLGSAALLALAADFVERASLRRPAFALSECVGRCDHHPDGGVVGVALLQVSVDLGRLRGTLVLCVHLLGPQLFGAAKWLDSVLITTK